jgi:hypothetical protein
MDIWELFEREEQKRLAHERQLIADEKAAWDALTPEQKEAHAKAVEAKFAAWEQPPEPEPTECEICGADLDDEGCRYCDGGEEPED